MKNWLTRDRILFTVGTAMLVSQTVLTFVGRSPSEAVLTAGAGVLLSPLALRRDESKRK